jgi:chemotaxis response regulator CheB
MTYVLLLDRKASQKNHVQDWLSKNGLVTWMANDVSHAIEELSDFTVRNRPDVVLLEVAFLADSFDALQSTFNVLSPEEKVTVLGLTNQNTARRKFFASDFEQLGGMMMQRESCV